MAEGAAPNNPISTKDLATAGRLHPEQTAEIVKPVTQQEGAGPKCASCCTIASVVGDRG